MIKAPQTNTSVPENSNFVVGLSAAILALYPFREVAEGISLYIFGWEVSLYVLAGYFLSLLLLAAYLYGLNHIRYNFSFLLTFSWLQWLRFIEPIAHVVYIAAFTLPIAAALAWLVSLLLTFISSISFDITPYIPIVSGVLSGLISVLSFILGSLFYKSKKDDAIAAYQDDESASEIQSTESFNDGHYKMTLLNLFQAIMSSLNAALVRKIGLDGKRLPSRKIIEIAVGHGILTPTEAAVVADLQGIRNRIAHDMASVDLSQESAQNFINLVKPILARLRDKEYNARMTDLHHSL